MVEGQARQLPPMGWYPDPAGSRKERYWDGNRWTRNLRSAPEAPRRSHSGALPESLEPIRRRHPDEQPRRRVVQRRSAGDSQSSPQSPSGYDPGEYHSASRGPAQRNPYDAYRSGAASGPGRLDSTTSDGVPLAGWWWRVLASLIDQAVIWTIVSILLRDQWQAYMTALVKVTAEYTTPAQLLSALQKDPNLMVTAGLTGPLYTLMIYAIFGQAIYQFVMLVACSASLGQLIAGLRVVEVGKGREHSRLIWWRAAVRALTWGIVEVVNIYLGMLTVLSYLMPLFQRRRQTLHDLAGGTQVIRPVRR